MSPTTSKRERNKARNLSQLVDATLTVFATIGYRQATVRDIVQESGLSRGSFYNYFGDKEQALAAVAEHLVEQIRVRVQSVRANAPDGERLIADSFAELVQAMSDEPRFVPFLAKNGEVLRSVVAELEPTGALTADLQRDLEQAVATGLLPPHRSDWFASAMVGGAIEVVTRFNADDDPATAGRFLTRLYLQGVGGLA